MTRKAISRKKTRPAALSVPYALGYPRIESLNRRGFLVRESDPKWVDLPKMNGHTSKLATLKLHEDGSATGVLQYRMQGYSAMFWRHKLANGDQVALIKEQLTKTSPEVLVEKIEVHSLEKLEIQASKDRPESSTVYVAQVSRYATKAGKRFFVPLNAVTAYSNVLSTLENRRHPVVIRRGYTERDVITLQMPGGYQIESTPDAVTELKTEFGNYRLEFERDVEQNKLVCKRELVVKWKRKPDDLPLHLVECLLFRVREQGIFCPKNGSLLT